jgi:GNAT superfamily N-acetyltransferase
VQPPGIIAARVEDAEALAALVNEAYRPVEGFLYDGPRTDADEVRARLARGCFLLHPDADGSPLGCVYVEAGGERGYLGMLAVAPRGQGRGLGKALVEAGESWLRSQGVGELELEIVSARPELLAFYQRLGFRATGERPFDEARLRQPCHFVVMSKRLA